MKFLLVATLRPTASRPKRSLPPLEEISGPLPLQIWSKAFTRILRAERSRISISSLPAVNKRQVRQAQ